MMVRFSMALMLCLLAGCVAGSPGGGGGEYTPPPNAGERFSPEGAPECAQPSTWVCPEVLPWDDTTPLYLVQKWGSYSDPTYTIDDEPSPEGLPLIDAFCTSVIEGSDAERRDSMYWGTQWRTTRANDSGDLVFRWRGIRTFSAAYDAPVLEAVDCYGGNAWAYRRTTSLDGERLSRDEWPQYGPTAAQ